MQEPLKIVGLTSYFIDNAPGRYIVQSYEYIDETTDSWSHLGINYVEDGDTLLVYEGKSLLFHNIIEMVDQPPDYEGYISVHKTQKGMAIEAWKALFNPSKHAVLFKKGYQGEERRG